MWSAAVTVFTYALAICVSAAPVRVSPPPRGSLHLLLSSPGAPVQGADSLQPRVDAVKQSKRSLLEIGDPLVDLLPIPAREKLALSSSTTASDPPLRREEEDIDPNTYVDLNVRALAHLQNAGNPLVSVFGFTVSSSTLQVAAPLPTTTPPTRPRPKFPRGHGNHDNQETDGIFNNFGNPLPCHVEPWLCD